MKNIPLLRSLAVVALVGIAAHAQSPAPRAAPSPKPMPANRATPATFDEASKMSVARVKFSDPTKPGTLKFSLPWADVTITGTDGDEVVVASSLERKRDKEEVDADGYRRLDEDTSFELTEKNNVVGLALVGDQHWLSHGAEFDIKVPRNTNLIVRTHAGGDIEIINVDGEIDVNSMNGEVRLTDISASAVVNTMNGEVRASFRQAPSKPVSITSMNGEIDLLLPADTKANIRMRTHNGAIRTNFAADELVTKSERTSRRSNLSGLSADEIREVQRTVQHEVSQAVREAMQAAREAVAAAAEGDGEERVARGMPVAPVAPVPTFGGGKSIVGTLNGGGVDISLSSMNGAIRLSKR